jgi:folate-binding protein YgfZ
LTTNKARVIAHLSIWHRATDVLLLDFAGPPEKVEAHLNHYRISEQFEIRPQPSFCVFRIVGPNANAIATAAGLAPVRAGVLPGFESLDVFPDNVDATRQRILDAGALIGDTETYNVLRIEAGVPEVGIDIDEDRLAMEVNRPDAISYTKGCYLGQETIVMARDRGQVNRKLMGLRVTAGKEPVTGARLFRDGNEAGQVTSSTYSPRLHCVIALGYLRRGSWDAGTELTVEPASAGRTAVVCSLPFAAAS